MLAPASEWTPRVSEFPVSLDNQHSRTDFVIKHRAQPIYLVAECKRANPALAAWCFIQASYVPIHEWSTGANIEGLQQMIVSGGRGVFSRLWHIGSAPDDIYHLGLPFKTNALGDPCAQGREDIESAVGQLCRAVNGLINFFYHRQQLFNIEDGVAFLPVLFTTAKLYVTDFALGNADPQTGDLDLSQHPVQERQWLFYHYHQSQGLKHHVPTSGPSRTLEDVLYYDYVKTIAIVNIDGVEAFLRRPVAIVPV